MIKKNFAAFILILSIFCFGGVSVQAAAFYDVPDDFWAAPYISNLESRGIISGYGDGYFLPHNNVQRCEYAKMLVNASGLPLSNLRTSPYADLDVNEWYFPYVCSITAQMPGYQSTTPGDERIYFKPEDNATREDVTVALMRVLNYDLSEYYPVSDDLLSDVFYDYASIPKQDRPYIAEAVKRGYITGTQEGTFLGSNPITRCEVSAVLWRAFPEENLAYIESSAETPSDTLLSLGVNTLTVHYLDVGQGDSIFIELPSGGCMLIDASTADRGAEICTYIKSLGYSRIDYLIATHPHADHIGGMLDVINNFDIGCVYMPSAAATTKTYENFLSALIEKQIQVSEARAGVNIIRGELSAELLAPSETDSDDLNNSSAVLKLSYGDNAFLFMGDAEKESEEAIMAAFDSGVIDSDVIKIGHHGSDTSSTFGFIAAVSPEYAVISCGAGNSYGHPSAQTLETLMSLGVTVFRTDIDGTVKLQSDGTNITQIN